MHKHKHKWPIMSPIAGSVIDMPQGQDQLRKDPKIWRLNLAIKTYHKQNQFHR
jgi:hypothetical protein